MALTLHTRIYGQGNQGKPLVILHGLYGSAINWGSIANTLAKEGFMVYAMDLRNHGASPHHPSMTYVEMAADVLQTMAEHGLTQASCLGHSMGGKTAMMLALMAPSAIDRLIVADIAPVDYTRRSQNKAHRALIAAMATLDLKPIRSRTEADHALRPSITEHDLRAFLLSNLVHREGRFCWRINLDAIGKALPDILDFKAPPGRAFAGPTLFLSGGQSDYVRQEDFDHARLLFPNAQWKVIENARHWLHVDAPEAVYRAIFSFLSS